MVQNPENRKNEATPRTWVVDEATGLSDLETHLNHLETQGFPVRLVFLLRGLRLEFVILARRSEQNLPEPKSHDDPSDLQGTGEARHA